METGTLSRNFAVNRSKKWGASWRSRENGRVRSHKKRLTAYYWPLYRSKDTEGRRNMSGGATGN